MTKGELIAWTPELEAARIALCEFWVMIADDPHEGAVRYPELGRRALETEQALTILGEYARLADALALTRVENRNEVYGDLATTVSEATRDPIAPAPREEEIANIIYAKFDCREMFSDGRWKAANEAARAIHALSVGGPSPSTANVEGDYGSSRDHAPAAGSALEADAIHDYVRRLTVYACSMYGNPDWRPLADTLSLLTQLDNALTGLSLSSAKQTEGDRSRDELNTSSQPVKILPDTEHDGGEV